ncbi:MAG TPA: MFS transporter [Terriglobia bacterium]|nr:MFS transporter [Terriglobia bacterium]
MTQSHDAYAALRAASFRRYLIGNGALFVGLQMQKVAVGWEIYERTGSAMHLGYVGLAQFLPVLGLTLFAGHATDSFNRKHVLMAAVALSGVAAFGLAWTSATTGPIPLIYLFLALSGIARAFWMPARAAFLPRIVPREIFSNAVSWNSTTFELASWGGPLVGGIMIALLKDAAWVYIINAVCAALFLSLMSGVTYRHQAGVRQPLTADSLLAGFRYIRKTPVVLGAITLDMFGVLLGGATAMMPIYAKDILAVGPGGLGWLLAAPSIGACSMAMIQARRPPFARAGRALLMAVAGFGLATILFGISENFWFSLLMLLFLGAFDNISVVIRTTLVQMLTPDEMRGRVSSINGLFIGTSNELGAYESALVANSFGPVASVVSGGIGTGIVVAATAWLWPQLRNYREDKEEIGTAARR